MNGSIVTFGESLVRLSPPNHLRLQQASSVDLYYGGSEANVAVSLANWDLPVQYVTRLPDNELGTACMQSLRKYGVGVDFIELGGDRLGLYFLETGSANRPSRVIYDRAGSSFGTLCSDTLKWNEAFAGASWFHWSGISPAVSVEASQATQQAVDEARRARLFISCDLNYRHSLWHWGESPSAVMPSLVKQCDVLAANSAHLMLDLPNLPAGRTPDEAIEACSRISEAFPNLKHIAMTCREKGPGLEQRYTAVLWQQNGSYVSEPFRLPTPVEQIGAGDAFMAGLIYGLNMLPENPQAAISFAAASAVLKYTIMGDVNVSSVQEIEQLLRSQDGLDILR